jgi:hypothetical protein
VYYEKQLANSIYCFYKKTNIKLYTMTGKHLLDTNNSLRCVYMLAKVEVIIEKVYLIKGNEKVVKKKTLVMKELVRLGQKCIGMHLHTDTLI